ncbi:MAG: biopolymer transporter ExbD [Candidatus Omnitrophica bacterium]|nr:biopolymer transporter ExbD [Candidatus Omnitrophota bacterium]
MSKFPAAGYRDQRPTIQMAPLIDIVFLTLIFFMTLSIFNQMESELSISVPKAEEAKQTLRSPGEIIINIAEDGTVIVNQKKLSQSDLKDMLKKISALFPNQPVIIRADENTYHKFVIGVLDACASADIWNISFSTTKTDKEEPGK